MQRDEDDWGTMSGGGWEGAGAVAASEGSKTDVFVGRQGRRQMTSTASFVLVKVKSRLLRRVASQPSDQQCNARQGKRNGHRPSKAACCEGLDWIDMNRPKNNTALSIDSQNCRSTH